MVPDTRSQANPSGAELPGTRSPVLTASNLCKSYGAGPALRGLTFSLQPGRVLGFLGPNGAGKTTTIRILTTMLEPTSGDFSVAGVSSKDPKKIRRKIGVLPEGLGFPNGVTAIEYLVYFGRLFGRSADEARSVGLALLKDVGMQNRVDSAIGTFSHGMRQRLGIARALVNDPAVVFLDEPTLGLDPRGQTELLALIRRIAHERNAGVVLSSHLLPEIENTCDDLVILNAGRVVAEGTVAQVTRRAKRALDNRVAARIRVPKDAVAGAATVLRTVPGVTGVMPNETDPGWLVVDHAGPEEADALPEDRGLNPVLSALIAADIPVIGLEVEGRRLQDVFLELTAEAIE